MDIQLTQDKIAQIDDADAGLIAGYCWHAVWVNKRRSVWYASTMRNGKTLYMHRLLMGEPVGKQVDHKDGDGLNNQRGNLRLATPSQNVRNGRKRTKRGKIHSQYKGVSWHTTKKTLADGTAKIYGRWRAEIELPGRVRKIKYAKTEEEAARIHDALAKEHFGEFALLNFVEAVS